MKHLKLFEEIDFKEDWEEQEPIHNDENIVLIKADTSAVMLDISELEIGKLCIKKAKISGDKIVVVLLFGFSSGVSIFHYNNGKVTETTEKEFREILDRNNIKTKKDLDKLETILIDLY